MTAATTASASTTARRDPNPARSAAPVFASEPAPKRTVLRELGGGGPPDVICGLDDFDEVVYGS